MEKKNKDKKDNKKSLNKILRNKNVIIGAGVIIVALIVYFAIGKGGAMSGNLATTSQIDDNSYNQSKIMRVDLNDISSIDFDLGTCDVRIQRSSTNPYIEYTVLYKGEDHVYDMDVSFSEGAVKLKSKVIGKDLYMKDKMPIVRIFLPKDATVEQIKGKVTAGDIKISDLNAKNIDLAVKSGNISIENALLRGSISTESGSINLNKSEIGETKLATISGNINIAESKLADKLDFSTQTGDIIVASENKVEDYNVTAKINLGKFILGNISYKNIKDGYKSESKGKYDISMRTKIGDIIFNKGEGAVLDNDEYITNQTGKEDEETDEEKDSESEDEGTKEDQDKTADDNDLIESDSKEDTTDESSDENDYDTGSESEENQDVTYDEDVSDSEEESSDY